MRACWARVTLCRLAELPLIWNRVLTVCACSMERSTARQERLLELQLEDAIHNADGACTWPPVAVLLVTQRRAHATAFA